MSSPGGFIDGVTLDNLLTVEPHGKNPAFAGALKRIGLAEGVGNGKSRSYILSENVYKVNGRAIQYVRQTGIDRARYPEMIIKLANTQDGFITKQDVAELLKITPEQAYSEIKKLVEKGKVYKYQGGKYTKYRLS